MAVNGGEVERAQDEVEGLGLVPGAVVAVRENDVVWEVRVVVDYVGEVGHGFAALVKGDGILGVWVIGDVVVDFPAVEE